MTVTPGRVAGARLGWSGRRGVSVNDLVDTTEMYLRTVFELEEEGVVPLRARIAERLEQSGPTVSQTVARMERDGLLLVAGDRHLQLTDTGRALAVAVMRKHRLAECLLVDVIGLRWEDVHAEACRWEHVMSEAVERRLVEVLGHPTVSPYGNPIPGLDELGAGSGGDGPGVLERLSEFRSTDPTAVVVRRISEHVQTDVDLMGRLRTAGVVPDARVTVQRSGADIQVTTSGRDGELLPDDMAHAVQVERLGA